MIVASSLSFSPQMRKLIDSHCPTQKSVRSKKAVAYANTKRKLSDAQVIELRNDHRLGMTYKELEGKYGITAEYASHICAGRAREKHIPLIRKPT